MTRKTDEMIASAVLTASRLYLTTIARKELSFLVATTTKARSISEHSLRKFSSLIEVDAKYTDAKTKVIEVLIWHDSEDKSHWGHAALRAGMEYLSVWPRRGVGPSHPAGKSYPCTAWTHSYEEDVSAEGKRAPNEIIRLYVTDSEFTGIVRKIKKVKVEILTEERGYVAISDFRAFFPISHFFKPSINPRLSKSSNCITSVNYVLIGTCYHVEALPLLILPRAYSKLIKEIAEKRATTASSSTATQQLK